MNTKFVLASVFAAVSGLAGLANTASAGPDFHVSIGIGTWPGPVIVAPRHGPPAPVYGYGHDVRHAPGYREVCPPPAPRGFWQDVSVKVWVPAQWVVSCDHHGREFRTLRPGYFTYRTDRVWVADNNRHGDFGHGQDNGHRFGSDRGRGHGHGRG